MDYVFLDPAIGQNRQKHSWVIRHDGFVFGSGWYEDEAPTPPTKADPPAYTQYLRTTSHQPLQPRRPPSNHRPLQLHRQRGRPWYMFIVEDDEVIVHATLPERIGTGSAYRTDIYGKPYGQQIAAVTEAGRWVDYVFLDPAIGQNRQKHSWVIRHDGLIFGSGWYEDEAPHTPHQVGRTGLHPILRTTSHQPLQPRRPPSNHRPLQLHRQRRRPLVHLHHRRRQHHRPRTRPDLRNTNITHTTDVYGQTNGQQIADATEVGRWVDYVFLNPDARPKPAEKHSWGHPPRRPDFRIPAWYEDEAPAPPTKADPPAYTQYFVQQAINRYNQDGPPSNHRPLQLHRQHRRPLVHLHHRRRDHIALAPNQNG